MFFFPRGDHTLLLLFGGVAPGCLILSLIFWYIIKRMFYDLPSLYYHYEVTYECFVSVVGEVEKVET
jgi:hypothetical protein